MERKRGAGGRVREREREREDKSRRRDAKIVLFDVDGTPEPRKKSGQDMRDFLQELRKVVTVGIVGGSDLKKIKEQLGDDAETAYDYLFSENGLVAHKAGTLLATQSRKKHLGEDKLKCFINFTLKEIAEIDIPVKRGTFIEFRNGMLNVSPVGRNCSQEERDAFEKYDAEHGIKAALVDKLKTQFGLALPSRWAARSSTSSRTVGTRPSACSSWRRTSTRSTSSGTRPTREAITDLRVGPLATPPRGQRTP